MKVGPTALPPTADFGSGTLPVEVIIINTAGVDWRFVTVMYRSDRTIQILEPWTRTGILGQAPGDVDGLWRYVAERIEDGRYGNAHTWECDGFEVADVGDIAPIVHARSKPPSGRYVITRVAHRDVDAPDGERQREAASYATGGQHEWFVAVPWIYQLLASPATRGRFLAAPDQSGDTSLASAYWTPLLQLLIYSFGWARPDRGLKWWYDAGKPTDDRRLELIAQIWDSDGSLDQFAAWLWANPHHHGQDDLERLTGWADTSGPVEIYQPWLQHTRDTVREDDFTSPLSDGTDPLHLAGHSTGPLDEPPSKPLLLRSPRGNRHAVLLLDSMIGWYRALATHGPTLPDIGERSWRIDVIVKPVGHLGTFRRSRQTGLWFAGRHRHHVHGV